MKLSGMICIIIQHKLNSPKEISIQSNFFEINNKKFYPHYRHPADSYPPTVEFTSTVEKLRKIAQEVCQVSFDKPDLRFNHAIVQLYRKPKDNR